MHAHRSLSKWGSSAVVGGPCPPSWLVRIHFMEKQHDHIIYFKFEKKIQFVSCAFKECRAPTCSNSAHKLSCVIYNTSETEEIQDFL